MKTLSAFALLIAGIACGIPPAMAQNTPTPTGQAVKKAPAKKKARVDNDEKEPDINGLQPTLFDCELGDKLTIYRHAEDDQQIALRWNKRLHHMTRVGTTTGAHRFENAKQGLVWIGIPAKGMLLDSRKGRQLANECKSGAEQATQHVPEQKLGIAP